MSIESLFAMINQEFQPPQLFCAGLLASVVCCLIALIVESKFRRRELHRIIPPGSELAYRQFLSELNSAPRHVGFAGGEVYDLDDRDFPSTSK